MTTELNQKNCTGAQYGETPAKSAALIPTRK